MLDALPIQTDSDCPGLAAVQAEVRELTTPEQRRAVPPDALVTISDRGDTLQIEITREGKTTVRTYRDAARDCERRAHFASVLVVVSLMPPELGSAEPEPEPLAAPRPPAPSAPPPRAAAPLAPLPPEAPAQNAERSVHLELGARGELGTPISDSARVALVGADLRVALGAGALRLLLGLGYAPTARLRYTGDTAGHAELRRLDLAVGARYGLIHSTIDVSIDANLLLTRSDATGLSAQRPAADTSFSAGGRLGIHAAWDTGQFAPFVGVFAAGFSRAPAITQLPQGTVGHLPYVWLGASAGLSLAL